MWARTASTMSWSAQCLLIRSTLRSTPHKIGGVPLIQMSSRIEYSIYMSGIITLWLRSFRSLLIYLTFRFRLLNLFLVYINKVRRDRKYFIDKSNNHLNNLLYLRRVHVRWYNIGRCDVNTNTDTISSAFRSDYNARRKPLYKPGSRTWILPERRNPSSGRPKGLWNPRQLHKNAPDPKISQSNAALLDILEFPRNRDKRQHVVSGDGRRIFTRSAVHQL